MLFQVADSPASAVSAARDDLAKLPSSSRADFFYLSLYNIPADDRAKLAAVLNGHCNSLSSQVDREPLAVVSQSLLRLNIRDYGWSLATMRKLADPRFTVTTEEVRVTTIEVPWAGGIWPDDGKFYQAGSFSVKTPKREVVRTSTATAPWLDTEAAAALVQSCGYLPVVSGAWFLNQTAIQEGRAVGYYDMLGITARASFEKLVRFSEPLAAQLEHRRAVVVSGITLQPRRIELTKSVMGTVFRTFDNASATDERNPIRILDTKTFKFDATEQIAPLPNGLPAFLLADSKGVLQSKAPDQIVGGDKTGHGNDTRLHANLSCIRCHNRDKGENFVKEIDWAKLARLKSVDYNTLRELKRQYTRDIQPEIEAARVGFGRAIMSITGMQPQEYAAAYAAAYSFVEDAKVDAAYAARDMGLEAKELVRRLKSYDFVQDLDAVASIIMNGGAVPVRQFEEVLPILHSAVRSVK